MALDPTTGEVLALVSQPGYDPNLFVDGIDQTNWDALNGSEDRPLNNRALQGAYPPGSTFKPYMALAALELGKRTPQSAINDPGFFNFGGHRFRDDKPGGHGYVDLYKSIVVSCDTYYYMLSNDLGIDAIATFMAKFKFGDLTGIDIKGEKTGVLPSQAWKQKRFKQKWYAGETISVGIGQGYNAFTPIQLANAVAVLANGGVMMRPHLVHAVQDSSSGKEVLVAPFKERTIPLAPGNLEFIKNAMIGVNKDKEGTAMRAFVGAEYTSAGKTGTSQVIAIKQDEKYVENKVAERHRDHALFIAFAPADKPKIAVAVVVENSGFGAQAAAPIVRQVLDYYLLGKKPIAPAPVVTTDDESD